MSKKLLNSLNIVQLLNEGFADCVTESGKDLVNRYRSYLYSNNETYGIVNNFINEASTCAHDAGISRILDKINNVIEENKVSWNLASITEALLSNENMSSYNLMVKNYANHMNNVLESSEEKDIVKMIYEGNLKSMNFIPEYRNYFNSIYTKKVTEAMAPNYYITNPMSFIYINESGDQYLSVWTGNRTMTYKINHESNEITEGICNDATFNKVNNILTKYEANGCINENNDIVLKFNTARGFNYEITVNESSLTIKNNGEKVNEFSVADYAHIAEAFGNISMSIINLNEKLQFNNMYNELMTVCENISNVYVLDNVKILNTLSNATICIVESENSVRVDSFNDIKTGNTSKTVENIDEAIKEVKRISKIDLTNFYENINKQKKETYVDNYVTENKLDNNHVFTEGTTTQVKEARKQFLDLPSKVSEHNSVIDLLNNSNCAEIINKIDCVTEAAQSMVNKYKTVLVNSPLSYSLANSFIAEANKYAFDDSIKEALEILNKYVKDHNISWRLATVCESIAHNNNTYNYIGKIGIEQVEKLLEMKESDVISYIKAGALKSVQYIPEFRSICKDVYRSSIYESAKTNRQYEISNPISYVYLDESAKARYFNANGKTYKVQDGSIEETVCEDKTFNEVNHILSTAFTSSETHLITEMQGMHHDKCTFTINVDEKSISVYRPTTDATLIKTINEKFDNLEKFNDWSKVFSRALSGNEKFRFMNICESVNKVYEHIDNIFLIDNTSVIVTENAVLSIIEGKDNVLFNVIKTANNMPASSTKYEYMAEAINQALKITGINLSEHFQDRINEDAVKMNKNTNDAEIKEAVESTRSEQIKIRKRKLAMLAEKYKNDPARIAVLNKIAEDLKVLEA